ncbi:peptide ABC transporter permease [Bacillus canaveralius]|uniref:Peptide ABC transporter permease n=1 Tax=Bacillus canaveralius TaxID=1403243 RepID=A0A2N5GKN6_9BACI|nr:MULTISPECIES: ABC transporter permease [Bacillus]PLR81473.1 peptide ABC transporter permease [Bacillus sp. V33-4]PLR82083.1 peptide ABC transporter permease [Bacillus canaveralius]PLR98011.1 peptide ABC transporter permease [Bacillus canaveralius]
MQSYVLRRFLSMFMALFIIVTLTFLLMQLLPGTPYGNIDELTDNQIELLDQKYGLDQPVAVQYVKYLGNLIQGDLGLSFKYAGRSVNDIIGERIGPSALIGFQGLIIGAIVGLILGITSALRHNTFVDYGAVVIAVLGMSIPSFIFAALMQYFIGVKLGWLPPALWEGYQNTIMPSIALSVIVIATVARFIRTEMLEVLGQDYVLTAKAKGISRQRIVIEHVVRNALIPVITMLAPLTVGLLTGTLVIEKIFAVPGIGEQFTMSIMLNDYSVIMGITIFYSIIFVIVIFLVDLLYVIVDPRIRLDGVEAKS